MVWVHTRDEQSVNLETRFDAQSACYQLVWRYSDGTVQTEAFADNGAFARRVHALQEQLLGTG